MALLRSSAIVGPCDGSDLTCFKMDLPNDEVKILVFSVLRIAPLGVACFVNSSKSIVTCPTNKWRRRARH